jgi:hypothetical protein
MPINHLHGCKNMTTTSNQTNHKGNPAWKRGAPSANPKGRPLTPAGIRRRLLQDLAARVLAGDPAAVDAYIAIEKAGSSE